MEKIKAIEISLMNPKFNLVQLKGFRYFAIDRNGAAYVYSQKPTDFIKDWDFHTDNNGNIELVKYFPTPLDWRQSLREINFEEQEQETQKELYQRLYFHLSKKYEIHLTDEEIHEIVLLAKKIKTHETDI